MEESKRDPRVLKTKKSLGVAMFVLLEKNSFDKITVNDICNMAMVSRTTFYQHFPDKYELVKYSLNQEGREIMRRAAGDVEARIGGLLHYVQNNQKVFLNLIANRANEELLRILSDTAVANLKHDLETNAGAPSGVPAEVAAVFLSGGMASLMRWWIDSNCLLTAEEITRHLLDMFRGYLRKRESAL